MLVWANAGAFKDLIHAWLKILIFLNRVFKKPLIYKIKWTYCLFIQKIILNNSLTYVSCIFVDRVMTKYKYENF